MTHKTRVLANEAERDSATNAAGVTRGIVDLAASHAGLLGAVARVAAGTAALCISTNLEVPLQPVPFTLQILALGFIAATLRPRETAASTLSYVAIGALGAPVFSGFMGGVARLAGPTGGFILGFVAGATLGSWMLRRLERTRLPWAVSSMASLAVMTAVVYLCGWAQLMLVAHLGPVAAFAAGVAPFVALDLMKAGIATCATAAGRLALGRRD
ncbi:MAG: biotin transporter BioY [Coriobacteriales bacterium]|nr:biotin transporter BioY [Coriobacteriales bacterium]